MPFITSRDYFTKSQPPQQIKKVMTKHKRNNISNDKTELRRQEQIFLFEALPLLVHFSLGPRSSLVVLSFVIR